MRVDEMRIGQRVRAVRSFYQVPEGTEGVIDEDYGGGVMVAWDLPDKPLPKGYREYPGSNRLGLLRDGFSKMAEHHLLEVVDVPSAPPADTPPVRRSPVALRLRYEQRGGHIHCRLFSRWLPGDTYALTGRLVFDEREWPHIVELLTGVEIIPEGAEGAQ